MKALITLACFVMLVSSGQAALYTVTDLSTLPGGGVGRAEDINNSGVVVGYRIDESGNQRPFIYDGVVHDLPVLPEYTLCVATGINDGGTVVGYMQPPREGFHAYVWQCGWFTDLSSIFGYSAWALPSDINNSGQIAGTSYRFGSEIVGCAFVSDGGPVVDLNSITSLPLGGLLPQLQNANAINDSGQIAGWTGPGGNAFLWQNGVATDLGVLPDGFQSNAIGINSYGQVVGECFLNNGIRCAFLYDEAMQDLGFLPEYPNSVAFDINDSGQIVGESYVHYQCKRAVLFENGEVYDLNSLLVNPIPGWTLAEAHAVNNSGQIVGFATNESCVEHAVLLTPIPE